MTQQSQPPSLPRGVTAVLIGRNRAHYWSRQQPEPVEIRAAAGDFADGELENALRELVAAKTIRGKVALGFHPEVEFFATERKLHLQGKSGTMLETLVAELGQDMIGREVATCLPVATFATAVMVPGALARQARRGLSKLGQASVRFISTTYAVLNAATKLESKKTRRAEAEIRILLGEGCGMALLTQEGDLLARHVFEFSQAREFAVISAGRRLLGVARDSLHCAADPEIVLHSDEELLQRVCGELGLAGRCADASGLSVPVFCAALANCAFRRGEHLSIVLAGSKASGGEPAPYPVGGIAVAAAALIAVGFWMNQHAVALDSEIRNLEIGSAEVFERFGSDVYELRDHEERLGAAAYLAGRFAQDRVRWAPLLMEIPRLLPEGMALDGFEGSFPLFFTPDDPAAPVPADELANNRFCEFSATAPAIGGDSPPQVQAFTAALRESDVLRSAFRRVTGAGVVLHEEDDTPWVEALVRCLVR